VWRWAQRRRLAAEGAQLALAARDITQDPSDLLDAHRGRLAEIDSPVLARSPGDVELQAFLAEKPRASATVVAGTLAEDDRAVIIAPEGFGKSELLRQLVVTVPFGIHPFTFRAIPPVPTLLVDLENPRQLVRDRLTFLSQVASANAKGNREPCTLWHRPGGIDVRRRADRLALEDVLRRNRPKLVTLGPVYKAYGRKASESDEQVASEVQAILDGAPAVRGPGHGPRGPGPLSRTLGPVWGALGSRLGPLRCACSPRRALRVLRYGAPRGAWE
jgi:hypothetical protein